MDDMILLVLERTLSITARHGVLSTSQNESKTEGVVLLAVPDVDARVGTGARGHLWRVPRTARPRTSSWGSGRCSTVTARDSCHGCTQQMGLGEACVASSVLHGAGTWPILGATERKGVGTALMAPLRRITGALIPMVVGEQTADSWRAGCHPPCLTQQDFVSSNGIGERRV